MEQLKYDTIATVQGVSSGLDETVIDGEFVHGEEQRKNASKLLKKLYMKKINPNSAQKIGSGDYVCLIDHPTRDEENRTRSVIINWQKQSNLTKLFKTVTKMSLNFTEFCKISSKVDKRLVKYQNEENSQDSQSIDKNHLVLSYCQSAKNDGINNDIALNDKKIILSEKEKEELFKSETGTVDSLNGRLKSELYESINKYSMSNKEPPFSIKAFNGYHYCAVYKHPIKDNSNRGRHVITVWKKEAPVALIEKNINAMGANFEDFIKAARIDPRFKQLAKRYPYNNTDLISLKDALIDISNLELISPSFLNKDLKEGYST